MKVLFFDGANLIHRARYGFAEGNYSIVYNFFRSFRALVEQMKADKIIFALEGYPKFRYELDPEYKANRKKDENDLVAVSDYLSFKRQREIIVEIISHLPVELLIHHDYEADDLIGTLVGSIYKNEDCIIVTADTDYFQLIDSTKNNSVKIYNPIKKAWANKLNYNYVFSKSLIGDASDNIKGIPKVGPKTATKLLEKNHQDFNSWLNEDSKRLNIFEKNKRLITFADVPIQEIKNLNKSVDLEFVRSKFVEMNFKSILSEKSWEKFVKTFDI